MFMTMSWIFGSAILVKSIVYEKEQRLKETMKVIRYSGTPLTWIRPLLYKIAKCIP